MALGWQMGRQSVSTSRRWGIGLTAAAGALWVLIVVAAVTASPEDGANIGAGMLFLLATPCTVTGVTLLLTSRRAGQPPMAVRSDPASSPPSAVATQATGRGAQTNGIASWALVLGIVGVVLNFAPIGATEVAYWFGVAVAVAICSLAVALGCLGLRRAQARGGVNRSLALAGVIVGATGLGWNLFLIPELVLFLIGDL